MAFRKLHFVCLRKVVLVNSLPSVQLQSLPSQGIVYFVHFLEQPFRMRLWFELQLSWFIAQCAAQLSKLFPSSSSFGWVSWRTRNQSIQVEQSYMIHLTWQGHVASIVASVIHTIPCIWIIKYFVRVEQSEAVPELVTHHILRAIWIVVWFIIDEIKIIHASPRRRNESIDVGQFVDATPSSLVVIAIAHLDGVVDFFTIVVIVQDF